MNHNVISHLLKDSKTAVYVDSETLQFLVQSSNNSFNYTQLQERVSLSHKSFIFFKTDILYSAFNNKLIQLIESGISDRFVDEYSNHDHAEPDSGEPVVLTMEHLGVGFLVWLLFCLLSFVCFLIEVTPSAYRSIVR